MVHLTSSRSPWMIPVFLGATIPVLWWRRSVIAVTVVALAVMTLHDVLFGWVTRCGAGLPLAFVLAFLGALGVRAHEGLDRRRTRRPADRGRAGRGRHHRSERPDPRSAGPAGRLRRRPGRPPPNRSEPGAQDPRRGAAAAARRAGRARGRRRPGAAVPAARRLAPGAARSADHGCRVRGRPRARRGEGLLESIESRSRQTLDDMREIVGLLRGGDVALAPAPTVAHLDALLARHRTRALAADRDGQTPECCRRRSSCRRTGSSST